MQERNRWWVVLVSLGMVAYGGGVLWDLSSPRSSWTGHLDQMIVAALIAAVGAYALVMEIKYQPEDAPLSVLVGAVAPYRAAWSNLWRTKWLLWVYGCFAVVSVVDRIVMSCLTYAYRSTMFEQQTSLPHHTFGWSDITTWLFSSFYHAHDKFFPTIPLMTGIPLYALVLFCLAWWVLPRVQRLSGDPDYSSKTGLFSACLVVAALGMIVEAVLWVMASKWLWSGSGYPVDQRTRGDMMHWTAYAEVLATLISPIVTAVVMGGVIGSLARNAKGEDNVKATFLPDAVRWFAPLALLYLIVDAAFLLPGLMMNAVSGRVFAGPAWSILDAALFLLGFVGLASLLLMFAPFGIVTRGLGTKASIVHSIEVWKRKWKQIIVLIAVGTFFSGLVMLPVRVPWLFGPSMKFSWLPIPFDTLVMLVGLAIRVLILLAVWEFYQANVIDPESSSVTESGPSP